MLVNELEPRGAQKRAGKAHELHRLSEKSRIAASGRSCYVSRVKAATSYGLSPSAVFGPGAESVFGGTSSRICPDCASGESHELATRLVICPTLRFRPKWLPLNTTTVPQSQHCGQMWTKTRKRYTCVQR